MRGAVGGGAETAAARDLAADAGSGKHLSYNDVTVTTWRVWPGRSAPHVILRPSVVKMFPVHLRQDFGGVAGGRAVVDGRPFQKDVHCRRFVDVVGVVRRASERARRQDARKYFNRSVRRIYVCVCARAGGRPDPVAAQRGNLRSSGMRRCVDSGQCSPPRGPSYREATAPCHCLSAFAVHLVVSSVDAALVDLLPRSSHSLTLSDRTASIFTFLMRRLELYTIRPAFDDCLPKVVKFTVTQPASRSHADLFIYYTAR